MKVHLLYRDRDFDPDREPPAHVADLAEDLDLDTLVAAMAGSDRYLAQVARVALFDSLADPDAIVYRQDVLRDCLAQRDVVRMLYDIAVDAVEAERRGFLGLFGFSSRSPDSVLHSAVNLLTMYLEVLERLRKLSDGHANEFSSDGFTGFFAMIADELDDDYLRAVREHLGELAMNHGVRFVASLDPTGNGTAYVLRRHARPGRRLAQRLAEAMPRSGYTYRVADRDEYGARRLGEIRGEAVNLAANAAAQSADHIRAFFAALRAEVGVYLAALNLHEQLAPHGPMSFPTPRPRQHRILDVRGLYDPCLVLRTRRNVVANDLEANARPLVVITGANQGGKSTFLRSLGIAQLMMQSGMFVAAKSLSANVCSGVFTHFKREEDPTMTRGKLDEELARMSAIAAAARPNSMLLLNESFAATNEQEGSEIARQVITAFLDTGSQVACVTHMYELAHWLHTHAPERAVFLRAQREADGTRSYRLIRGAPESTSYGEDIYRNVFGATSDTFLDPTVVTITTRP